MSDQDESTRDGDLPDPVTATAPKAPPALDDPDPDESDEAKASSTEPGTAQFPATGSMGGTVPVPPSR